MSRNAVMFSSDVLSTVHARHVKKESLSVIADSLCVAHSTLRKQLSLWRVNNNIRGPGISPKQRKPAPVHVERLKKSYDYLESFVAAVDAKTCLWMGSGLDFEKACGCKRAKGSSYCAAHEMQNRRKADEVRI